MTARLVPRNKAQRTLEPTPSTLSIVENDTATTTTTTITTTTTTTNLQEEFPTPIMSNRIVMDVLPHTTSANESSDNSCIPPLELPTAIFSSPQNELVLSQSVYDDIRRKQQVELPQETQAPSPTLSSWTTTHPSLIVPRIDSSPCSLQYGFWLETCLLELFSILGWQFVALLRTKCRQQLYVRRTSTTTTAMAGRPRPFLLPSPNRSNNTNHHNNTIRGIPNYGQTCFLNVVLQSLASLHVFCGVYLPASIGQTNNTVSDDDNNNDYCVASSLLELLTRINTNTTGGTTPSSQPPIDPRPLLSTIGTTHTQFQATVCQQQDAQEVLQAIMDVLVQEKKKKKHATTDDWNHLFGCAAHETRNGNRATTTAPPDITLASVLQEQRSRRRRQQQPSSVSNRVVAPLEEEETKVEASKLVNTDDDDDEPRSSPPPSCNITVSVEVSSEAVLSQQQPIKETKAVLASQSHTTAAATTTAAAAAELSEEKKQEEFEVFVPHVDSEDKLSEWNTRPLLTVRTEPPCSPPESLSGDEMEPSRSRAVELFKATVSDSTPTPLSGWIGSALVCECCGTVRPITNTPFLDIPVVPTAVSKTFGGPNSSTSRQQQPPPCTLDECLQEFVSMERVSNVECKHCTIQQELERQMDEQTIQECAIRGLEQRVARQQMNGSCRSQTDLSSMRVELEAIQTNLKVLRTACPLDEQPLYLHEEEQPIKLLRKSAYKCLFLTRLPPVLAIHVQRRYFEVDRTSKTNQHVIFPQRLDVSKYCAYGSPFAGSKTSSTATPKTTTNAPIPYRLVSVIEHLGGPFSGHYVCYRRDAADGWVWISDNTVRVVDFSQVAQCQAYMLFYEAV